jgi:hypothetical protein
MAEHLRDVARRFVDGELVAVGEPRHAVIDIESGAAPIAGGFLEGPVRIVSAQRRQSGRWDVEFVDLIEAEPSRA